MDLLTPVCRSLTFFRVRFILILKFYADEKKRREKNSPQTEMHAELLV